MRKALTTAALTLGALAATATAASADAAVDHNEHPQLQHGGLLQVGLQDVLTNANILNDLNLNVLGDGVNIGDVDAL